MTFDDGGSGRQDLWEVGWRIFEDKPVNGVGLNNFRKESLSICARARRSSVSTSWPNGLASSTTSISSSWSRPASSA